MVLETIYEGGYAGSGAMVDNRAKQMLILIGPAAAARLAVLFS